MEESEFKWEGNIDSEPDFVQWVPFTLRKRDSLIFAVISITKSLLYKYGVQLQSTFQKNYDLDESNDNNLWLDALNK